MSGSPRSNNGSSVTSPSRPTVSPAADNSHLQQQQQQQQYQQQPMYGMPLSNQPVHATTAATSSTAAAAIAASAATTAAAAVTGSSSQPGQQSNFVPTGPYQYQGAYQPANLQRVNAAVLSLNQMFPTPMSIDGSSYQRGQMPQGSDGSNNSFSFDSSSEAEKPEAEKPDAAKLNYAKPDPAKTQSKQVITCMISVSTVYDPDAEERIHNRFNDEPNTLIPPEFYANLAHTIAGPNTWYLNSCCGQHMCSSETPIIVNQRHLQNPVVVTVANNQRLTAHWMGSIVLDSVEEDFSLHLNEVLLVPRLGFNLMSSAQLMKNGITLLGEPGKFTLKYGDKKLGTAVEQNGVFILNFIPERTTADSDNILSLGPWEHCDNIDYTDDTVPRKGAVPTSSTTAVAVMLTFDDQGLNDVQSSREYMAAVEVWGDPTNMPSDDGIWGADEPDERTWGETPAERDDRLLAEAEQRVADMEILDSRRLVGVEPVPAASDQESGELVLAPGEYVDVEVCIPPPNLTRYVAPAFDQIRSDGHQLLLSFFTNAEYYLRTQGHKATRETWHKRLGHPSQSTLNNTIKAAVLDKNSLLLPSGLELKPVNRPAPCTICPTANLPHESLPTHFPGAEDYHLMDKVYSDILNLPADGFNGERYVIIFAEASTRYQSGVAERLNRFLQEKMRALLAQAQLGPLYWPFAMDHATVLHNLLSSSALPNNASPYLLWTGKLGTTKLLRVFGCVVQYRPPTAPLGKFDQRAKWGLHLGIEKQYLAWRIMDYRSRLLVPAHDCIFYKNLTLRVFEQHLATQHNPATLFHGVRLFASADAELAASEEPDPDGAREAVPDPPVPVTSSGIPEFIPLADAALEDVRDVHHTYLVDEQRQPMPVVSDNSIRVNPDEIGGASGDQNDSDDFAGRTDDNLHYQTGLQILGLAAAVQHCSTVNLEPKTARQALSGPHREKWREAMDRELAALQKRETWDLIPIEKTVNKNVLTGKWVFRVKTKADGTYEKHKARWVVRGFDQTHGIDYTLTFAPVSRHTSVRLVLCEAAAMNFPLRQIDVSNAFLYADVDAKIYVEYPHTYPTNPPSVCKLKKSLYGIKQAPRLWQQHLNRKLTEVGFRQLPHDPGMYRLDDKGSYAFLVAYVDDILYVSSSTSLGDRIEADLKKSLDLTISTKVTQFMGLNVSRTSSAIHLTASKYAESLAKRFNISTDFVPTPYRSTLTGHVPNLKILSAAGLQLYQQQLGCLLFAAVTCRPDLAYVASHLAQFLRCPKEEHSLDLQRALRYFVSTPTIGLIFNAGKPTDKMYLSGYVDADHADDTSDRRSRMGYIFRLEPIGPISWNSSKQELVSLSSAEAEFIAACAATREGLYLQELLGEAKFVTLNQFTLQCDNQSAITIANKPGFVNRTKHISLRYFFVKDVIDKGRMRLVYCPTSDMAADSLTKKLTRQKFHHCNRLSGISESTG
ncbi:unnamed protein product [Closterium sp. NIES-54]